MPPRYNASRRGITTTVPSGSWCTVTADAVELGQRLGAQHVGGRPARDAHPLVEQRQPIAVEPGEREVVHGRHHRQPVVAAQPGDELQRLLLVADVEGARRLVEQQDRCLLGEGAGDDEPLPLAAAQRTEAAVGERGELQALEHVRRHRLVVTALRAEVADVRRPAEQHVLEPGHVVGDDRRLRDVGDELGPPTARAQRQRRAVDDDVTGALGDADDRPQQRGLAGAVGPDEAEPLAGVHDVAERCQRPSLAVVDGEVAQLERAHERPLVRSTRIRNGAPRNAVTTPIGVSAGFSITRPGMSATMRNVAPNSNDSGSTRR